MTRTARYDASVPAHISDREVLRMVHRTERRPRTKPFDLEAELRDELGCTEIAGVLAAIRGGR